MRCRKAEELLLARIDGVSPTDTALPAHLAECAACQAQEQALTRAFGALQATPGPAPDLWAQFQTRLGAEVDCQTAREQLPAYAEGALVGTATRSLQAHLAGCDPCAQEELALDRSLRALEQVAPAAAPDLWADFSAKLAASQPAPKPAGFRFPAWLLPGGVWRPGLALAGVALATVVLRGPLPMLAGGASVATNQDVEVVPKQARISASKTGPSTPEETPVVVASAKGADTSSSAQEKPKRSVGNGTRRKVRDTRVRRVRLRKHPVPAVRERDVEAPTRPAPIVRDRGDLMAVAPPLPMPEAALIATEQPADTNSETAQARIMPEAVQVGLMLARMESSVRKPFQEVGYEADAR